MYIHPSLQALSLTSSNLVQRMHPPLSTTTSSNNTIHLSQEHRTRLYQIINELTDDQLRLFLTNHLKSISNTTLNNQFQHYSRTQLVQQSYILIDSYYSIDLEQTLYTMRQKRFPADYQQQQQQQQQQIYRAPQQNYPTSYNQQPYYYAQQTVPYNAQPNYRFPPPSNASQQLRQSK
jgi:hypothetical protein